MSGQFRLADADAPLAPNTRIIFAFADGEPDLGDNDTVAL